MPTYGSDLLIPKANIFVHEVYRLARLLPKDELFGLTSQLRRAVLSVILNMIEGYARQSRKDHKRFLEISYASLKETKYLLEFSIEERYLSAEQTALALKLCDELGRMLWKKIQTLKEQ